MKLSELLTGVPLLWGQNTEELEISSISSDSRQVQPGGLFAAIRGHTFNGHDFIPQALARGAAAVLCEEPPDTPGPWLVTENSRKGWALLCANWFGRPGDSMKLAAVTGTNGKTTTTHLLRELIAGVTGEKVGLIGTNHCLMGEMELPPQGTTPDSYTLHALLARMARGGCRWAVMEASSHALDQDRLEGLTFEVGIFTNLSRDHLDYHPTMEDYRAAKEKLFPLCRQWVVNLDDEAGQYYAQHLPTPFTYSENRTDAHLCAKNLRLFPGHVDFEALMLGKLERIHLPIPGGFSVYNALAALGGGVCLGLPLEDMARVIRSVKGVKGRVEVVPVPRAYTVIIDYAHSPHALENILMTARDVTAGRLICLFGCGGDRDKTKRPIMGAVAGELADLVVLTSDNPRSELPEVIIGEILAGMEPVSDRVMVEPDREKAIHLCLELAVTGDVVVLAGKGHETTQEIRGTLLPMDERKIVADHFKKASKRRENRGGNLPALGV